MKTIFIGTSMFAVPSLEALIASHHDVMAVVTQPDRPKGRGREMQAGPVKQVALAHGIPVLQPEKISAPESLEEIRSYGPIGVMVVVAYGQKIPPALLEWPGRGVVNVHGSILPKYRGAAPVQHALIAGEEETGVTTMLMDEGWDTGDILLQESTPIRPDENAEELAGRLSGMGAKLLVRTLDLTDEGSVAAVPQDDDLATFAKSLPRDAGAIDWSLAANDIVNLIRGCTPKPGAFTKLNGSQIKVWAARVAEAEGLIGERGEIVDITDEGIAVAAGSGSVTLVELQAESRKRMTAAEFARGGKLSVGDKFDCRFEMK